MLKMFTPISRRSARAQAGFTLVEMSVVLLVIGLILGAVSVGKDVQRNAEYVKVKQKFVDPWASAYNSYFMRSGVVLGDSQVAPSFMVNGTAFAGTSGSTGNMTSTTAPAPICDAAAVAPGTSVAGIATLYDEMDRLGIRMPAGRAEGKESRYVYLDSNGNPQEIQICFQWNAPATPSNSGNVMVITGLTPDLARMLDQMIDGKADASEGMFRQAGIAFPTTGLAGAEWAANNTTVQGAGTPTSAAVVATSRKDEDQVFTVVAHYKMNQ